MVSSATSLHLPLPQQPCGNIHNNNGNSGNNGSNGNNNGNNGNSNGKVHLGTGNLTNVDCDVSSDCSHPATGPGCIRIKSRILPKLRLGRRLSKEAREMIDIGRVSAVSKTVEKPPAKDKAKDSEVLNTEKEKK